MKTVEVKKIKFNNGTPDFIFEIKEWYAEGGYKGIISACQLCIRDILTVETTTMSEKAFHSLPAWEG